MPELFDMISGTGSGAIIGSTLIIPKNATTAQENEWQIN
jgi:hypothetical protein